MQILFEGSRSRGYLALVPSGPNGLQAGALGSIWMDTSPLLVCSQKTRGALSLQIGGKGHVVRPR